LVDFEADEADEDDEEDEDDDEPEDELSFSLGSTFTLSPSAFGDEAEVATDDGGTTSLARDDKGTGD
jgi:hypothetical protein